MNSREGKTDYGAYGTPVGAGGQAMGGAAGAGRKLWEAAKEAASAHPVVTAGLAGAGGYAAGRMSKNADEAAPEGAAPAPGGPAAGGDEMAAMQDQIAQLSPEEFAQLLQHLTEMYKQAHGAGGAEPASEPAGGSPAAPPAQMHRGEDMARYSRLERENNELKQAVGQLQKFAGDLTHQQIVYQRNEQLRGMDQDGYTVTDRDFDKAQRYARDLWDEHVLSIQEDRPRTHRNDQLLPIAATGKDDVLPERRPTNFQRQKEDAANMERHDKVIQYMREQGCDYDTANKVFDKNGRQVKTA